MPNPQIKLIAIKRACFTGVLWALFIFFCSAVGAGAEVSPLVAAGKYHSVSLRSDGTVWSWGDNVNGQLGNGTYDDSDHPQPVSILTGVTGLSSGGFHSIAVKSNGTVWAWGNNESGRLGNGSESNSNVPVQALNITGVIKAGGGYAHTVALKSDGTVWAWGRNLEGQLGNGSISTKNIIAGKVVDISGVTEIASGFMHCLALRSDGTVWSWGSNEYGQLGDGSNTGRTVPVQVSGLSGVVAIAAGAYHSLALKSDGSVWSWGANENGQLGDGTAVARSLPAQVSGLTGAVSLSAGYAHTVALLANGTAFAWGWNSYGQLGDGTVQSRREPVPVIGISGGKLSASGYAHTIVMKDNGQVMAWGYNGFGQLGDGSYGHQTDPVLVIGATGYKSLSVGYYHASAVSANGELLAWGRNSEGQLGDGSKINKSQPTLIAGVTGLASVVSGGYHSMALKVDGSVLSWGNNTNGQLGDGTLTEKSSPLPVSGLSGIIAIAAGCYHSVALKNDGTVWTWGDNSLGQLGDGTSLDRSSPVLVAGIDDVIAIAAGSSHTIALKSDGTVWTWGSNSYGQLGDGTNIDRNAPVQVSGLSAVVAIASGCDHSLAVISGGTLRAWGANTYGQLGDGTFNSSYLPVDVSGISGVTAVKGGGDHTLAIAGGNVWSWGGNWLGQLGNAALATASVPQQLEALSGVTAISAGYANSAAIKSDGTVWGWGDNLYGTVGDGNGSMLPHNILINLDSVSPLTVATPSGGSYAESVTVELSCSDSGTGCIGLYYTMDGSTPTWPVSGTTEACSAPLTLGSSGTISFIARDLAGNISSPQIQVYSVLFSFPLTIQMTGTGSGGVSVSPSPPGISCTTSCSQSFLQGTVATLTPAASNDSIFSGWSGCESVSGNACTVSIYSAVTVTASFAVTPSAIISSQPAVLTGLTSASFSFYSGNPAATFECSLDSGEWAPCASPKSYSDLAEGVRVFSVRAVDGENTKTANPPQFSWTIDTTPPESTMSGTPASPSNLTGGSIALLSSEAGSTFECSLDGAAWVTTPATYLYGGLAAGAHNLLCRASDPAGNVDPTPAEYNWIVDTKAPITYITVKPASLVNQNWGSISFMANEGGSTFQCKMDSGVYLPCSSPYSFSGVTDGAHVFMVRAIDPAGNVDNSLLGCSWSVDTSPPDTTVTAQPVNPSNKVSGGIGFSSSEAGASFECSMDGASFTVCTSPYFYSGLTNGAHQFQVRAKDLAGNRDITPSVVTWTIDTVWPDTLIVTSPPLVSSSASGSFSFSSSETGVRYETSMDGGTFISSSNPYEFSNLANGSHTLQVRAIDAAGNIDLSSALYTWTIDAPVIPCNAMVGGICYPDVSSAYNSIAAPGIGTIKVKGVEILENALVQRDVNVTIEGGYDELFISRQPETMSIITGSLTVGLGSVVADALEIR